MPPNPKRPAIPAWDDLNTVQLSSTNNSRDEPSRSTQQARRVALVCPQPKVAETRAIRAELVPLDREGNYQIDAEGFSLKSRYPENRIAKVLFDAGYRGQLEVFGRSADSDRVILRLTCDIEKMAAHRMSEGDRGIRLISWTEMSLAALKGATKHHPFTESAENNNSGRDLPPGNRRHS